MSFAAIRFDRCHQRAQLVGVASGDASGETFHGEAAGDGTAGGITGADRKCDLWGIRHGFRLGRSTSVLSEGVIILDGAAVDRTGEHRREVILGHVKGSGDSREQGAAEHHRGFETLLDRSAKALEHYSAAWLTCFLVRSCASFDCSSSGG